MRLVVFDEYRIGVLESDGIHDLTDLLPVAPLSYAPYRMNEFIARFEQLRPLVEERRGSTDTIDPAAVQLQAPSPRPRNFLGAPLNYHSHSEEMKGPIASGGTSAREMGFFVKASGALTGASGAIELPRLAGRRFDHEAEIGFVIGRETRGVSTDTALDHVFGYTLVMDNTMRMTESNREERTMRKSFATLSPAGPCIVTADEVPEPGSLELKLWVNDELRQVGQVSDLIVGIPELIAQASAVVTLFPGDLYATGTPSGVAPLLPGDRVVIASDQLGAMDLAVVERSW